MLVLLLCVAAASVAAAPAAACDPAMPVSEVTPGMTGTGLTVARGRTREPFAVEVLGVLKDGIGPGRDMIIIQASSPSITAAGGIWAGMSGSPIYVGGRLMGALAYGFSATSNIAGVTSAQDMTALLTLRTALFEPPETVPVPAPVARDLAEQTGEPARSFDALTQLPLPLSVSGMSRRSMRDVRAWAEKEKLNVIPFAGSSVARSSAAAPPAPPQPGDNIAAVAAYGDVTLAGVGTVTWTCGDQTLAFGHPFLWSGRVPSGANAADAFAVVQDPIWGPFKFAAVAELLGTVDQDRLSGIRAHVGQAPPTIPIRSFVSDGDTGRHRSGATDLVQRDLMWMTTFLHVMSNIDATHDAIGRGTAELTWVLEGTRADGTPWRLTRGDLVTSRYDVSGYAADTVAMEADMLGSNFVEDALVNSVSVQGSVDDAVRQYTLTKLLVAKGTGKLKRARSSLVVTPGTLLRLRSVLKRFSDGSTRTVDFQVRVPRKGRPFGMLQVSGGMFQSGGGGECEDEDCEQMFGSFDELLKSLQARPRSDELTVRLRTGNRRVVVNRKARLDGVIIGGKSIMLRPPGGGGECCEDGETIVVVDGG
jgi:hypothetical protein